MTEDQKKRTLLGLVAEKPAKPKPEIVEDDDVPPTVRMKTLWWKEPAEESSPR